MTLYLGIILISFGIINFLIDKKRKFKLSKESFWTPTINDIFSILFGIILIISYFTKQK